MHVRRILVVDDNEALRDLFRAVLEARGIEVCAASSAREALDIIGTGSIDAVVTDYELPGPSGFDLCRWLTNRPPIGGRCLPVWLMTGSDDPAFAMRALTVGARGLLRKPFKLQEACAHILRTLEKPLFCTDDRVHAASDGDRHEHTVGSSR